MSETKEFAPVKSYELVSDELVGKALKIDKGPDVELLTWEVIPFTNKGDNYSSVVAAIKVTYRENDVDSEYSYVAKLNPLRPSTSHTETMERCYTRETQGPWMEMDVEGLDVFGKMLSSCGEAVGNFLKTSDAKYEKCSKWLLKKANTLAEHYLNGFKHCNDNFDVLIHGDCWTNNMLFKYNEDKIPVDFRFVDLQCSGKSPATTDLNYFFFTSLIGDFRRKNLNTLITAYYESFSDVLKKAGRKPPFSYLQLKQELHNRKIFGMASAMLVLQFILAQVEDVPDIGKYTDDKVDEFLEVQKKTFEKMSKREGPFRDRYIAIFDDMLDTTIFEEY